MKRRPYIPLIMPRMVRGTTWPAHCDQVRVELDAQFL
jgi:hypothetical protein